MLKDVFMLQSASIPFHHVGAHTPHRQSIQALGERLAQNPAYQTDKAIEDSTPTGGATCRMGAAQGGGARD